MVAQQIKSKLIGTIIFLSGSLGMAKDIPVDAEKPIAVKPKVHLIYMGGNDCPPCVEWRQSELPKLQKTAAFKEIEFDYVMKSIRSSIPLSLFLPKAVKPYKDLLDKASGGSGGSPQFALLVDGRVYDYFFGTRDADTMELMLQAALTGSLYPLPLPQRCLQLVSGKPRMCEIKAP